VKVDIMLITTLVTDAPISQGVLNAQTLINAFSVIMDTTYKMILAICATLQFKIVLHALHL